MMTIYLYWFINKFVFSLHHLGAVLAHKLYWMDVYWKIYENVCVKLFQNCFFYSDLVLKLSGNVVQLVLSGIIRFYFSHARFAQNKSPISINLIFSISSMLIFRGIYALLLATNTHLPSTHKVFSTKPVSRQQLLWDFCVSKSVCTPGIWFFLWEFPCPLTPTLQDVCAQRD